MAMNRVQFQKGLSMTEFIKQYGTQSKCEKILEKMRWPQGFVCPKCESQSHCIVWHGRVKTFQCHRCHSQVTLTSGTIFHSSKLSLVIWMQAMYLMAQTKNGIAALELMRTLGVCYRTAWRIKHKLMQVMIEREEKTVLKGRVELDDAYLGGVHVGGKVGRGSENKVPFVAAVETDAKGNPCRTVLSPVQAFSQEHIYAWARRYLMPSTLVVSDGLDCFRAVGDAGCTHQPEVVGAGRKSSDMPCLGYPFNRSSTTLLRWITLALASIIRGPWASSMPGSRRMRTAWTTSNGCDGQPASFVRPAGMMWAGGLVTGASCARSAAAGRQ